MDDDQRGQLLNPRNIIRRVKQNYGEPYRDFEGGQPDEDVMAMMMDDNNEVEVKSKKKKRLKKARICGKRLSKSD